MPKYADTTLRRKSRPASDAKQRFAKPNGTHTPNQSQSPHEENARSCGGSPHCQETGYLFASSVNARRLLGAAQALDEGRGVQPKLDITS